LAATRTPDCPSRYSPALRDGGVTAEQERTIIEEDSQRRLAG